MSEIISAEADVFRLRGFTGPGIQVKNKPRNKKRFYGTANIPITVALDFNPAAGGCRRPVNPVKAIPHGSASQAPGNNFPGVAAKNSGFP